MKQARKTFQQLLLVVCSIHLTEMSPIGHQEPVYALRYLADPSHGLLTLWCLKDYNRVEISNVKIWLNRTSVEDKDIRERADIQVTDIKTHNLTINFTRGNEGDFSCGNATWVIKESEKVALVGKHNYCTV